MNRSWNNIDGSLAEASHRLRGYTCGVWAPGFEQCEDQELPTEVRDLCMKVTVSVSLDLRRTFNVA